MNRAFKELGYYSKKMAGLAGLLALLFAPLSFVVANWIVNLSNSSKLQMCEVENYESQQQLSNYFDQLYTWARGYQQNNFSAFTNEILFVSVFKVNGTNFTTIGHDYNDQLLKELNLKRESLLQSLQPAFYELTQKAQHSNIAVASSQHGETHVWSLSFKMNPSEYLIVSTYPRQFLKYTSEKLNCDFAIFTTSGQTLLAKKSLQSTYDPNQFYSFVLKNPISSKHESLHFTADSYSEVQIRLASGQTMIATLSNTSASAPLFKRVLLLFTILGVIAFLIALIPLSKNWFTDLQTAKMMSATLSSFTEGNYTARPRLFLTNHFSEVESSIDKLGVYLDEFKSLGSSFIKSNISPEQLREIAKKSQAREVVVLSLYLPALSEFTSSANESLVLYNEISEVFAKITKKNSGIIDFTTPQHLQSVWGLISESEFDSANAGMTALELRVAFANINQKLVANKRKPSVFGLGIHRAPAQVAIMGAEQTKSLSVLGDPNYEALSLSRLSAQLQIDILISEVMATLIEPYFVLAVAQEVTLKDVRLYTIQGYVDNQENPVLIRSKKLS